jgi:cytochrome c-type biogenesis protein CcmH
MKPMSPRLRAVAAARAALGVLLALAPIAGTWAVDPARLSDPALQARYEVLIHELRCVQCEDNSLADSDASIAADLRHQIRDMLSAGKTDGEIKAYLVSRYSEFILFRPEYSWRNAWLWALPGVLLLLGVFVAARIIRQRAALVDDDPEDVDVIRS